MSFRERSDITDLNNELGTGQRYSIYFAAPSFAPAHLPSEISDSKRFFLEIINNPGDVIQRVTVRGTNETYQRVYNNGTFSSWSRIDAFGCATPSDLASLLGEIQATFTTIGTYKQDQSVTIGSRRGRFLVLQNTSRGGYSVYFLNGEAVSLINEDGALLFSVVYSDGKSNVKFTCTDTDANRTNELRYRYI